MIKDAFAAEIDKDDTCSLGLAYSVRDLPVINTLTTQQSFEIGYAVGRIIAEEEDKVSALSMLKSFISK